MKLRGDHSLANFIRACCVLHNLALDDEFPAVEEQQEDNIISPQNQQVERDERSGIEIRTAVTNMLPLN